MCIYRERERGRERDREEGKQIIIGMYIKRSTKRHTGDLTDPSGKGLRVSSLLQRWQVLRILQYVRGFTEETVGIL